MIYSPNITRVRWAAEGRRAVELNSRRKYGPARVLKQHWEIGNSGLWCFLGNFVIIIAWNRQMVGISRNEFWDVQFST